MHEWVGAKGQQHAHRDEADDVIADGQGADAGKAHVGFCKEMGHG